MPIRPKYNLEHRTLNLSKQAIVIIKQLKPTYINQPLAKQLIRSITSVGANYCEATEAESKKDFAHKISLCKKEAKESLYWIKLLSESNPETTTQLNPLHKETHELLLIFSKILKTCRTKKS
jgi:four helix bundle protein